MPASRHLGHAMFELGISDLWREAAGAAGAARLREHGALSSRRVR